MLVLERDVNESVEFHGGDGEWLGRVTVLRTHGGKLRLGIEAPATVRIMRSELLDRAETPIDAAPAA